MDFGIDVLYFLTAVLNLVLTVCVVINFFWKLTGKCEKIEKIKKGRFLMIYTFKSGKK